jgi:hypothetical protein
LGFSTSEFDYKSLKWPYPHVVMQTWTLHCSQLGSSLFGRAKSNIGQPTRDQVILRTPAVRDCVTELRSNNACTPHPFCGITYLCNCVFYTDHCGVCVLCTRMVTPYARLSVHFTHVWNAVFSSFNLFALRQFQLFCVLVKVRS